VRRLDARFATFEAPLVQQRERSGAHHDTIVMNVVCALQLEASSAHIAHEFCEQVRVARAEESGGIGFAFLGGTCLFDLSS
jgi:hypothetical protein